MNSREGELRAKKEANPNSNPNPNPNPKLSSRQWSSHKNPRIVRVSRTFGGKDRHSKVCTVRGLRDRRIRLSVPTAIQLYDLQHRLGLSQPSKVIDWLLDATKHDIDALPPLPIIPPFHHQPPHESLSNLGFNPTKQEVTERENQEGFGGSFLSAQNLFPLNNNINHPSFPPYLNFQWEPPGLSLAHMGGGYPLFNQTDQDHLYMCPSATTTIPSVIPSFPSYITPSMEISTTDWRLMNNNLQQNQVLPTTLQLSSSKSARSQKHDNNQRVRGKDEKS